MMNLVRLSAVLALSVCASAEMKNVTSTDIRGIWWWTWSSSTAVPSGTNTGVAFSGWADPYAALQDSAGIMWQLPGTKYISLGGGNSNGRFTQSVLDAARDAIYANAFAGYDGIVYDIEEGDAGLTNAFTSNFAAAKSMGYRVLVTVSHSAPYGISDAASLMRSFFTDNNIDYLSPQLYTSGTETWNDYTTVAGVEWWEYGSAKAAVVPSVSYSYLYGDAEGYFQSQGVSTIGYVQWSQSG